MTPYADPPKNLTAWLIDIFAAEINMLRYLNGLTSQEAFEMLFYSEYCDNAMNQKTDAWSIPPYWGYAAICKENGLEQGKAEIGYPFPNKERVRILVAYILSQYESSGIRPDFLYELMVDTGIFKTYADGKPVLNMKALRMIKAGKQALEKQPKDAYNDK